MWVTGRDGARDVKVVDSEWMETSRFLGDARWTRGDATLHNRITSIPANFHRFLLMRDGLNYIDRDASLSLTEYEVQERPDDIIEISDLQHSSPLTPPWAWV